MNFEALTKDELVYILRENEWRLHGVNFEASLRRCRSEKEQKRLSDEMDKTIEATNAYLKWRRDHAGMKMDDIPWEEIQEGARLERAVKAAHSKRR